MSTCSECGAIASSVLRSERDQLQARVEELERGLKIIAAWELGETDFERGLLHSAGIAQSTLDGTKLSFEAPPTKES